MNRTLRVALSACLLTFVLTASVLPTTTTGNAAPAVRSSARHTQASAQTAPTNPSAPPRDERLWKRALALHRKAIIVDGHNDIPTIMVDEDYDIGTPSAGKYHTDIPRLKQSGMTGEFFSIYVDRQYATPDWVSKNYIKEGGSSRRALDLIDATYRMVEKYPADLMFATSTADIRRAKKEGKVGVLMGIEGGHAIENSLSALREFYRLGVRYMTLTHNNTNEWADACCDEARHNGLSDFGKEVVREMNRLGMFADISHVSDKTMSDVLDVSKAPVIASHSSARVFSNHKRNIPDDLLKRIGQNGGVVMVNFYTVFLDERVRTASLERDAKLKAERSALNEQYKNDPKRLADELQKLEDANPIPGTTLSMLVDHIDHIAKVAGIDHVGLGSDFDGGVTLPEGIKDVADLPNITYELLRRGYSDADVLKILGGNFMRAFAEVERVAGTERRKISGEGSQRRLGSEGK
ncbi:MAG: rane dipeptidase [Acidobacteriota bacterium]|jgi:membrane dipeptidase|nr:rane dipeptidase [Acidobacteriota bacterium]